MDKSKGHIGFVGIWEYFTIGNGDLYRAKVPYTYIEISGYRSGARFVAPSHMAQSEFENIERIYNETLKS